VKATKVEGKIKRHKVLLYAISTCAWCKKAKGFLKDHNVEYEYIDVDLCSEEDREKIRKDIMKRGGRPSFPTIIVDDKAVITGFHEDKIKEALES